MLMPGGVNNLMRCGRPVVVRLIIPKTVPHRTADIGAKIRLASDATPRLLK